MKVNSTIFFPLFCTRKCYLAATKRWLIGKEPVCNEETVFDPWIREIP